MERPRPVPILMYHSLDDSGSVISVRPPVFRRQMDRLRQRGFVGLRLRDVVEAWRNGTRLPDRSVVLTFDDGFRNLLDHAVPVLKDCGFSATVFVVAGYCGRANDWPGQPADIPRLSLLAPAEVQRLAREGIEIGAHGQTHAALDRIEAFARLRGEVAGARLRLEDLVGQPVTTFAYPYGLASPACRRLVAETYTAACSTELRTASFRDALTWLPRIEMYYFRHPALFPLLATPVAPLYLGLRRLGRALRPVRVAGFPFRGRREDCA